MDLVLKITGTLVGLVAFSLTAAYFSPRSLKRRFIRATILKDGNLELNTSRTYESPDVVLPHGELQQVAKNVWVLSGTLPQPGPKFNRNMTVWRAPNSNKLVIHSPICVDAPTRAKLESLGTVACVLIPSMHHRVDENAYRQAYPEAIFACPSIMASKLAHCKTRFSVTAEIAAEDLGFTALSTPAAIEGFDELVYLFPVEANAASRQVAVFNDLMWNLDPEKADPITNLIGSAMGFGMTAIGCLMCGDKLGLMRQWFQDTFIKDPKIRLFAIVVAHGDVVELNEIPQQLNHAVQSMTTLVHT
mmetsp:Transcript_22774/g.44739  ORF Transcript_22774/g.44739 Transcript_22774/m.44739 type:complete len:303 (-) Transcript_22774:278-1186(-)|eukprot:CAMPEP_0171500108 /NCGR_PEP_ID=MMETSP0958-20121227/8800_1 /TAXON_ID=87120 /ORGANISM="Aurantiochytrium limacinum, Strain ATCCMYA-1381" /LENGTH=302 /DNA_ID=CAMNT_0012034737 /DNA_START=73 /DNA_END=981 /DNA_ORIENTATION=+